MKTRTIKTFNTRPEAECAKRLLAQEGIQAVITADDCGGLGPHLALTTGGIKLLVHKDDFEKAAAVLNR